MTDYQVKIVPCKKDGKYTGHMKQIVIRDGEFIVSELCQICGIRKKIDNKKQVLLTDKQEMLLRLPI